MTLSIRVDSSRVPRQRPRPVQTADASLGLGQPGAIGLGYTQIIAAPRQQLVGLVENYQVVDRDPLIWQRIDLRDLGGKG